MKMSLERLLTEGKIESIEINKNLIEKAIKRGEKDLQNAKIQFENNGYDWTLAIAYNTMLQSGRALMFSKGYRPKGKYKHLAVIEFTHSEFGDKISSKMIRLFDSFRKKRNKVVYEEIDIVSKDEAKESIEFADDFLKKVKALLKSKT